MSYFLPKNHLATRFSDRNCTLIDNFLCKLSPTIINSKAGILMNNLSDHLPYAINIPNLYNYQRASKFIHLKTNDINSVTNFKMEIINANIYDKLNHDLMGDPNDNYNIVETLIQDNISTNFPTRTVKFNYCKKTKNKWVTNGIIKSIKFRNCMYKKLKTTHPDSAEFEALKINFRTYNKILKRNIKMAKYAYYQVSFSKYKNDIKGTWSVIKEVLNKTQNTPDHSDYFKLDGCVIADKITIANQFNKGKSFKDYLHSPVNNVNFKFKLIDIENAVNIIDGLKTKSSCGHDGLSVKMLKQIKYEMSSSITLIINQSLTTGIFPERLKIAKVIPIYKKDDVKMFENYRPISILPAISKILEKTIFNQLHDYFQDNKLYCKNQYGFRRNHSTEYAALELIDRVILDMDKSEIPFSIFIDLSKAFNTLDHNILINKLQYYGIKGRPLDLFQSYLSNRRQYVQFGNNKSDTTEITTGVPQGSILGPQLFIIYINDIIKFSTLFHTIIYADDTTLVGKFRDFELCNGHSLSENINYEITKLTDWLNVNKLSLNTKKTKLMIFHTPQKSSTCQQLK